MQLNNLKVWKPGFADLAGGSGSLAGGLAGAGLGGGPLVGGEETWEPEFFCGGLLTAGGGFGFLSLTLSQ